MWLRPCANFFVRTTFWHHRWRLWSIIEKARGNIRDYNYLNMLIRWLPDAPDPKLPWNQRLSRKHHKYHYNFFFFFLIFKSIREKVSFYLLHPASFSFFFFSFFFFVLWYLEVSRVPAQRIVRRNNNTFSAKCEWHPIRWLDSKHLRRTTRPSSSASPGTSLLSTLIHWCILLHWSLPLPKKGMMMTIVAMIMTTIRIIKMTTMKIMTMMFSNTYSRPVMREQIPLLRDSVERSGSRLWYLVGCWRNKKKSRHLTTIDKNLHTLLDPTPLMTETV